MNLPDSSPSANREGATSRRDFANSQAPTIVIPIHQSTLTLKSHLVRSPAKILWAVSKPLAVSMSWIAVCPVSLSVPAAFTPCRMKNVASVTMKLGSFVLITVRPLTKPTRSPNSSTRAIAGQTFMS